jgi:hypothetical protein
MSQAVGIAADSNANAQQGQKISGPSKTFNLWFEKRANPKTLKRNRPITPDRLCRWSSNDFGSPPQQFQPAFAAGMGDLHSIRERDISPREQSSSHETAWPAQLRSKSTKYAVIHRKVVATHSNMENAAKPLNSHRRARFILWNCTAPQSISFSKAAA